MLKSPIPGAMEGLSPFRRLLGLGAGDVCSRPNCRLLREPPEHAPKKTRVKDFIRELSEQSSFIDKCLLLHHISHKNSSTPSFSLHSTKMSPFTLTTSLLPLLDVTRRLARGPSRLMAMTTPSFVAGLSQVRPERLIEQARVPNDLSRDESIY